MPRPQRRRVIVYRGVPQPDRKLKLVENREGKTQCPRCGSWVLINKNGQPRAHRRPGKIFMDRVPCFTL